MHSQNLLIALKFCFCFVGDAALLDAAKKGNLTRVSVERKFILSFNTASIFWTLCCNYLNEHLCKIMIGLTEKFT